MLNPAALTRFVAFVFWGAVALGQTPAKPVDKPHPAAPELAPAAGSGLTVFVDPVTRQIRQPTASEIGAVGAASQAAARVGATPASPQIIQGPGAAIGLLLDDSAMSFMVATKKPDGKLAVECVVGAGEAASHVSATRQSPTPKTLETK